MRLFKYVNVMFVIESNIHNSGLEELLRDYFDGNKEYQTKSGNWVVPAVEDVEVQDGE